MKLPNLDPKIWKPRALYGGFTALAFLLALRWTFPAEAVKERLIYEAGLRGWQIDMTQVSAGGLLGVRAEGVKLDNGAGLTIPIESLTASLRPFAFLVGRRSVTFDARIFDGRVRGHADVAEDAQRMVAELDDVDLHAAAPLRKATGLDLLGKLSGTADLTLPAAGAQRSSGRVDLKLADAGLGGAGAIGGVTLPKVAFGQLTAAVKVGDGRATFEKLEAKGGDADLQTEGLYFVVQPRMEFAPISGKAKLKVHDAFWSKGSNQALRSVADLAFGSARGPDGAWTFTVTGSVGHPRIQPASAGGQPYAAPPSAFGPPAPPQPGFGGQPPPMNVQPPPGTVQPPPGVGRGRSARPADEE